MKRRHIKTLIYKYCRPLAFAWGLVIFILCATPGRYIPSASWMELLSLDKLVHASVFFMLTLLLLAEALRYGRGPFAILLFILIAIGYGASLEWMQARFFSERSADWLDIAANSFGCLAAAALLGRLRSYVKQME